MKKIIIFSFLALAVLASCTQKAFIDTPDQVGISKVTHYITFTLTGNSTVSTIKGAAYVDPGYVAMEGTSNVTTKVKVQGTVDITKVGIYKLTYVAVNVDGYSSTAGRTVIVYDPAAPATDFGGTYLSNVSRVSPARSFTGLRVTIQKMAPGFFYISDFFGGFYDQGSNYNYGPGYAMTGYVTLNPDFTLTLVNSKVLGWGDSLNKLTNAVYNPVTQGLSWDAFYSASNYDFKVTLVKQ
jgi:hypothetical protein